MKKFIPFIIALFLFTGCATMDNFMSDLNKNRVLKKALIQSTIRHFLGDKPVKWARSIYIVTEDAIEKVEHNLIVNIDGLETHVKEKINFSSLYASDQIIIQELINNIKADLVAGLQSGQIVDTQIYLKSMLIWINGIAKELI